MHWKTCRKLIGSLKQNQTKQKNKQKEPKGACDLIDRVHQKFSFNANCSFSTLSLIPTVAIVVEVLFLALFLFLISSQRVEDKRAKALGTIAEVFGMDSLSVTHPAYETVSRG